MRLERTQHESSLNWANRIGSRAMPTRLAIRLKEAFQKLYKAEQPTLPTIIWHESHTEAGLLVEEKKELMLIANRLAALSEPHRNGILRDLDKRMRCLRWRMEDLASKPDPVGEQANINLVRLGELREEMIQGQVSSRVLVVRPVDRTSAPLS